jgi:prepilin-type N-terminal cleavage/methylation domain-containing protein
MFLSLCKNDTDLLSTIVSLTRVLTQTVTSKHARFHKGRIFSYLDEQLFGMTSAIPGQETMRVQIRKADGFTLLEVLFVCGLIGVLSAMALPRLLMAKQAADASSAIGSLRTINSSELAYASTCGGGFYSPDLTTLGTAPLGSNAAFISPDLSSGNTVNKSGYVIQLTATVFAMAPATCNGLGPGAAAKAFKAGADPAVPSNVRFFATNADATIFEETSTLFAVMPETGTPPAGHPLQ